VTDPFAQLAVEHGLEDRSGSSPDGLPERYLYSQDMVFRYAFGRWWGDADLASSVVWVLLNPATGDTEKRRRPTLDRCIARSREMGANGLLIVNLFAYRHTNPAMIRSVDDPVGPAGDDALRVLTAAGQATVAAWGSHGSWLGRSSRVGPLLDDPMCLGTTAGGEPRHPLYVPAGTALIPWRPAPTG
jgi:hypothetical protein